MKKASMREATVDYSRLFSHVENLRKVLLVACGRSGSDFFQSLLDGHSEILQFTGVWYFHQWWKEAKCKENLPGLINEFIWHTCHNCNHIAKFKSYCNKEERWDQLGVNRDEFFEVDIDIFRNHMLNILSDKGLSSKNFFLAVNLAYGLTTMVDIEKTKLLFYHIHHHEELKEFKEDFPDFDVICTIREPRNTLVSGVEHWKRYDIKMYNADFLCVLIKKIFDESEPVRQYTKQIKTLKLEDLHLFPKEVLEEFCRTYELKFEECMLESSYHGKKWWGDVLSVKYLDGFNKKVTEKKWKEKLFFHDNFLLEFILEDKLRHYRYPIENRMTGLSIFAAASLFFLPMKYELDVFVYNFRNCSTMKAKIRTVKNCIKFYLLRILMLNRLIWKKIRKKTFLPDYFYSNNLANITG